MNRRNKGNHPVGLDEDVRHLPASDLRPWMSGPNDALRERGDYVHLGSSFKFGGQAAESGFAR